jgi:uncharacterized alkaline shock family protein YloU
MEPSSSITYASEVVAIIAGLAASEVEGVAGMCSVNNGLKTKQRNATRGVKVEVGTEEVSVEIFLNVEYGTPIQRAAHDVQEGVKKSIESMTGLHVVRVDVHVQSVSFEKENKALQAGAASAALEAGEETESIHTPAPTPVPEAPQNVPDPVPEPVQVPETTADIPAEAPAPKADSPSARKKSSKSRKTASPASESRAEEKNETAGETEENGQGG